MNIHCAIAFLIRKIVTAKPIIYHFPAHNKFRFLKEKRMNELMFAAIRLYNLERNNGLTCSKKNLKYDVMLIYQ